MVRGERGMQFVPIRRRQLSSDASCTHWSRRQALNGDSPTIGRM